MLDYSYEYLNSVKIAGCLPSSLLSSNEGIARYFRQMKTGDLGFTEEKTEPSPNLNHLFCGRGAAKQFFPQNEALFVAAGAALNTYNHTDIHASFSLSN